MWFSSRAIQSDDHAFVNTSSSGANKKNQSAQANEVRVLKLNGARLRMLQRDQANTCKRRACSLRSWFVCSDKDDGMKVTAKWQLREINIEKFEKRLDKAMLGNNSLFEEGPLRVQVASRLSGWSDILEVLGIFER
jgi:hypothetical protein